MVIRGKDIFNEIYKKVISKRNKIIFTSSFVTSNLFISGIVPKIKLIVDNEINKIDMIPKS